MTQLINFFLTTLHFVMDHIEAVMAVSTAKVALSGIFVENRLKTFLRLKQDIESVQADGKQIYVVNDEDKARRTGLRNITAAQSSIISIIPISAASTNYVFQTKDGVPNSGNATILAMESRLKDQDVFYTSALGFFLTILSPSLRFFMWAYPYPSIWPMADPIGLMGLWTSGFLEVKVNGQVVTPKWWMARHAFIPQTQSTFGGIPVNPYFDQQNFGEDGYCIVQPSWVLNGGNNNLYTLSYGNNWNEVFAYAPTVQLGLVMVWDGWLAQNASSIMFNQPAK